MLVHLLFCWGKTTKKGKAPRDKKTLSDRKMQMQQLKIKQLGQKMQNLAVAETGISNWEARELVNVLEEVYFSNPDLKFL